MEITHGYFGLIDFCPTFFLQLLDSVNDANNEDI